MEEEMTHALISLPPCGKTFPPFWSQSLVFCKYLHSLLLIMAVVEKRYFCMQKNLNIFP